MKSTIKVRITGDLGKSYLSKFILNEFPKYSKWNVDINRKITSNKNGELLILTLTKKDK